MSVSLNPTTSRQPYRTQQDSKNGLAPSDNNDRAEGSALGTGAGETQSVARRESNGNGNQTGGEHPAALSESVLAQMAVEAALKNKAIGYSAVAKFAYQTAANKPSGANSASEQRSLDSITAEFQQRFADNASDKDAFHSLMQQSFGANYDYAKAEAIRNQTLKGDFSWMPKVKLVDRATLTDVSGNQNGGVGLGAYSAEDDTIFLSRELLASDPARAEQILTEEVGHALDARLNVSDAAGDEGDIFSILSHGGEISEAQLNELRAENDTGTIVVDGKKVEVEFGLFSKIKRAFKRIGRAIKKAFVKLMQSSLFNTLLMIASFIPIPIVQIAVRVINVVKAAYNVYQGVKHGSIAAVLSGVAGVAGGVANIGKYMHSTAQWVSTASKIANVAKTASTVYRIAATKDFAAAAHLAGNYFGPDHAVTGALNTAVKVDNVRTAIKNDNVLGAINGAATLMQDYTGDGGDKKLEQVKHYAGLVGQVHQAADEKRYADAVGTFRTGFSDTFGFSTTAQENLQQVENGIRYVETAGGILSGGNNTSPPGATPGFNPNAAY